MNKLKEKGIPVNENATTIEEAKNEILNAFHNRVR
jgi:hypothetical protein